MLRPITARSVIIRREAAVSSGTTWTRRRRFNFNNNRWHNNENNVVGITTRTSNSTTVTTTTTRRRDLVTSSPSGGKRGSNKRRRSPTGVSRKEELQRIRKHSKEKDQQKQQQGQKKKSSIDEVAGTSGTGQKQTEVSAYNKTTQKLILLLPRLRYRYPKPGIPYTDEQMKAIAQRVPIWMAVSFFLLVYEETSPYKLVSIRGPSMIPTMNADGSDIWLIRRTPWWSSWWKSISSRQSYYKVNDLVGFAHPDHPHHISCKRIIGVEGDQIQRYGQYVHLYTKQDPDHWGITWPNTASSTTKDYEWMNKNWDEKYQNGDNDDGHSSSSSMRTIVVPKGHVWLEGDCPALAIDSRQYGPVPAEWVKGKIVARLWPLFPRNNNSYEDNDVVVDNYDNYKRRPHPIPLDEETLRQHNVHKIINTNNTTAAAAAAAASKDD